MRLVTRAEWGARSTNLSALEVDMVSVHWQGPQMGTPDHGDCAGIVAGFQRFHMDDRGWSDIAYNAVVCPHGYVFEGRGQGKRSAANGDGPSNSASYAVCFMGGEGDDFTDGAKDAINDAADWLGATQWRVHRDWVSTACPGDEITDWVRSGHPRSTATPTPEPPAKKETLPMEFTYIVGDEDWVWFGAEQIHARCGEGSVLDGLEKAGLVRLGKKPKAFHDWLRGVATNAAFSG